MFKHVEFYAKIEEAVRKYQVVQFEGPHKPPEGHTEVSRWVTPQSYRVEYAPTALLPTEIIELAISREQEGRMNGWSVMAALAGV